MPLTHRVPPAPVAAIHAQEVDQAARTLATSALAYLRRLLWNLEYPRTQWFRGTGQSARAGAVQAQAQGNAPGLSDAAPWLTGNQTPAGGVAGKAVLLALQTGPEQPVRSLHRYFDGLLVSTIPSPPTPLPPPVRPAEPAAPAVVDLDEDTYRRYVEAWGKYLAETVRWLVDREIADHWAGMTQFLTGRVQSVSAQAKTATVRLDQTAGGTAPTVLCGFGPRAWSPAQLAGRHVRVGYDGRLGYWIDDWS